MDDRELHALYIDGDSDALESLLKRHKGLVHWMANKYKWVLKSHYEIDKKDLAQACRIGLWLGINQWNPDEWSLANGAIKQMSNEIRRMIWKQQRAEEDGYTIISTALRLDAPPNDETEGPLGEVIKDPSATDPAEETARQDRCHEFFRHLEEKHGEKLDSEDIQSFREYVFLDWPPNEGAVTRIKDAMFKSHYRARNFWWNWMEDRVSYYPSQALDIERGSGSGHSDRTADLALKRIDLEHRLSNLLGKSLGV